MDESHSEKKICLAGMCKDMSLERKVPFVAGVMIVALSLLSMVIPGLLWILVLLGGAMVYAGMSGTCVLTMAIKHFCCAKGDKKDCDKDDAKGSCGTGGCG